MVIKGHYSRRGKRSSFRSALVAIAASVMLFCAIGGTLAWLTDSTEPIVNVFTYGDINIELTETKGIFDSSSNSWLFKMTPGKIIEKDPTVKVEAGSEDCWLFVKIDITEVAESPLADYIDYDIAEGWSALTGVAGVYYRKVDSSAADVSYSVLAYDGVNNTVKTKDSVTKAMLEELDSFDKYPKMTFTAYAVQRDESNANSAIGTASGAWGIVNDEFLN